MEDVNGKHGNCSLGNELFSDQGMTLHKIFILYKFFPLSGGGVELTFAFETLMWERRKCDD